MAWRTPAADDVGGCSYVAVALQIETQVVARMDFFFGKMHAPQNWVPHAKVHDRSDR